MPRCSGSTRQVVPANTVVSRPPSWNFQGIAPRNPTISPCSRSSQPRANASSKAGIQVPPRAHAAQPCIGAARFVVRKIGKECGKCGVVCQRNTGNFWHSCARPDDRCTPTYSRPCRGATRKLSRSCDASQTAPTSRRHYSAARSRSGSLCAGLRAARFGRRRSSRSWRASRPRPWPRCSAPPRRVTRPPASIRSSAPPQVEQILRDGQGHGRASWTARDCLRSRDPYAAGSPVRTTRWWLVRGAGFMAMHEKAAAAMREVADLADWPVPSRGRRPACARARFAGGVPVHVRVHRRRPRACWSAGGSPERAETEIEWFGLTERDVLSERAAVFLRRRPQPAHGLAGRRRDARDPGFVDAGGHPARRRGARRDRHLGRAQHLARFPQVGPPLRSREGMHRSLRYITVSGGDLDPSTSRGPALARRWPADLQDLWPDRSLSAHLPPARRIRIAHAQRRPAVRPLARLCRAGRRFASRPPASAARSSPLDSASCSGTWTASMSRTSCVTTRFAARGILAPRRSIPATSDISTRTDTCILLGRRDAMLKIRAIASTPTRSRRSCSRCRACCRPRSSAWTAATAAPRLWPSWSWLRMRRPPTTCGARWRPGCRPTWCRRRASRKTPYRAP